MHPAILPAERFGSDELPGQLGDLVEVLLDVRQGLAAVAVCLLRHVLAPEAKPPGVAVDDVGDQQLVRFPVDAAFDLEVEVGAAENPPCVLDYLEGPDGELTELFEQLRSDRRVAT